MFLDKQKVEDLILNLGLVTQDDFDLAKKEAINNEMGISDVLIRKGKLTEEELQDVQSRVAEITFIDFEDKKIDDKILSIIPEPIVRQYNIIAFDRDPQRLKVAVLNLEDLDKIDFLKEKVALRVKPYLTNRSSLNNAILQYQNLLKREYGEIIQQEFMSFQTIDEKLLDEMSREEILELARNKKANFIFEMFLKHALSQNATNIHIEPQESKVLIKYRIGGKIYPAMVLPKNAKTILGLKIKILAGIEIQQNDDFRNKSFTIGFDGKELRLQVNIIPSVFGERITLSILKEGDSGFSLESLGFCGKALDILHTEMDRKNKMVLIVGEKQSGKTTTFYTFLDLLRDSNLSIGTIEKKLNFQMSGVSQTVLNPEIGLNLNNGVNKLMKLDLDVVGVDELVDLKTIKYLFEHIEEDRAIFSVLETEASSSSEIISKLLEIEVSPFSLIAGLGTIILQKNISKLSEDNTEYYLTPSEINKISKKIDMEKVMENLVQENILAEKMPWSKIKFYKSKEKTDKKTMVNEVLKISPAIKELILNHKKAEAIHNQAEKEGMMTLSEDILFKAAQGLVSIDEMFSK